ncbi:MAG: preprotein translocase subunit SecG [Bacteroidetes bacterium]|nr:preprotein translocase subunit SecG [Bacteroidota bacterium]
MSTFLSIVIIIVCALLILIVLIQNPKGGGIASNFMSTSQFIGARQQVELIEQITWGFVGGLVVLCIAFAALVGTGSKQAETKESIVGKSEMPMPGGNAAPSMPAQQQQPAQQQPAPAQQPK